MMHRKRPAESLARVRALALAVTILGLGLPRRFAQPSHSFLWVNRFLLWMWLGFLIHIPFRIFHFPLRTCPFP